MTPDEKIKRLRETLLWLLEFASLTDDQSDVIREALADVDMDDLKAWLEAITPPNRQASE